MVDDQTHETSQKLLTIAGGVIDDIGESELLEDAYNEVEGYLDTANDWIGQDDWDTVYDEVLNEVEGVFNTIKDDIDEGLPEREYVEEESDDEFSDEESEGELIDISELWDELQEDEDMQEIKDELESADADLYAEYWGYIEEVVAIVDAAVDAQELYDNDIWDMDDFFYYLEEEESEALEDELDAVFDELDAFLDRLYDNSDFEAAVQALIDMWEETGELGDTPNAYLSQWYLSAD